MTATYTPSADFTLARANAPVIQTIDDTPIVVRPMQRGNEFIVALEDDGHTGYRPTYRTPAEARRQAVALNEAARLAERETQRMKEFNAKPHPTAQRDPVRTDCWIWCIDGQRFGFQHTIGARVKDTFRPGVDYAHGHLFDDDLCVHVSDIGFVTPERVALWTKLAYEAGYTLTGGF